MGQYEDALSIAAAVIIVGSVAFYQVQRPKNFGSVWKMIIRATMVVVAVTFIIVFVILQVVVVVVWYQYML